MDYTCDRLNKINIDKQVEILINRIQLILDNTQEWMYYSWFKDDLLIYQKFLQDDLDIDFKNFREAWQRLIEAWILEDKPFDDSKANWVVISIEDRVSKIIENK